jgi:WXXGXW repeat (2 copies)
MSRSIIFSGLFCLASLLGMSSLAFAEVDDDAVDILSRGPIHEAFAEPVVFNPEAGITIAKEPPEPIEEIPSEDKPEGYVAWIPGYWNWDEERDDFLWVSGFWRTLPPDREWEPGYWNRVPAGWQWVAGYWGSTAEDDVTYLPPPPASLEVGPSTTAPTVEHLWIPGCWSWVSARYAWKPGYWYAARPDWVWVPAHYVWTPRGCVFVAGYWDYPVAGRGMLNAPVCFNRPVYRNPHFTYCPRGVLDCTLITDCMFVRPRCNNYFFGDFYSARCVSLGYVPWFTFHATRGCYDPIYVHYHYNTCRTTPGVNWEHRWRDDYRHRCDNAPSRPPHQVINLAQYNVWTKQVTHHHEHALVKPVNLLVEQKKLPTQIIKLDDPTRIATLKMAHETRDYTKQRIALENKHFDIKPLEGNLPPGRQPSIQPAIPDTATKIKKPRSPIKLPTVTQPGQVTTLPVNKEIPGSKVKDIHTMPHIDKPNVGKPKIDLGDVTGRPTIVNPPENKPIVRNPGVVGREKPVNPDPIVKQPIVKQPKIENPIVREPPVRNLPKESKPINIPRENIPRNPMPMPRIEIPRNEAPKITIPKREIPRVEAPKITVPKVTAPKVTVPKPEVRVQPRIPMNIKPPRKVQEPK